MAAPQARRRQEPDLIMRVIAVHRLHGDGAGETEICRQRQIDIAGAERDDEHLPDTPTMTVNDSERESAAVIAPPAP